MDENNMELVALLKLVQPSLGERDHVVGNVKRLGKALGFGSDEISSESNATLLALQHPEHHCLIDQGMLDVRGCLALSASGSIASKYFCLFKILEMPD